MRPRIIDPQRPSIALYDAVEVQALNYDGTDYLQVEDILEANTFSVYWHLVAGGVDCIGDAATYEDAMKFAYALSEATGYPFNDMTP